MISSCSSGRAATPFSTLWTVAASAAFLAVERERWDDLEETVDETAHAHTEALLGIPFDTIVELWADGNAKQMQLADEAFTLLPALG